MLKKQPVIELKSNAAIQIPAAPAGMVYLTNCDGQAHTQLTVANDVSKVEYIELYRAHY